MCLYFFNIRLSNEDMWKLHKGLQDLEIMVHMEYQTAVYFVSLYFLALLFCQLPIYCFPSWHPHNGKFARWTLLKCYNACCTLLGGPFNIDKLSNLQLHILKSPFSHLHFYIANLTSLHYFTGCPNFPDWPPPPPPPQIHWLPKCFLKFFWPKLCFFGLFFFGVSGELVLVAYPPTS
jgi:hypothetical protein